MLAQQESQEMDARENGFFTMRMGINLKNMNGKMGL